VIHIGIPTLIETKSIEDCAGLCKEFGFQFIELNMNMPQYQIENINIKKFSEVAKKKGIYYTIHLDENLNVCDFNKKVAVAYLETVLATIELAKKLDVSILNMHLSKGVYFTMPQNKIYLFNEYIDIYLSSLESFRDKCEQAIGDANIKICIENSDGYDKNFLIKGLTLLLKSKVFGLTFDIGHNAGIGGGDEAVILGYESKLYHMHIHDAMGKKNHLPLGTGELDLPKYFDLAGRNNCSVVLETKTIESLRQSVGWMKSKS
jgi:sugar phosphate isomerase/epimerase